jgi:hypothetical protein
MHNREHMQQVKESVNEGYCDISGRAGDLVQIGTVSDIRVFAAPDVPDLPSLIAAKREPLTRFVNVVRTLGKVYALPPTSLHVFYDVAGSLIAFNSSGSLFCNLRYYEAWREFPLFSPTKNVLTITHQMTPTLRAGTCLVHTSHGMLLHPAKLDYAEDSHGRYFTLAHEIAHNLVQPHNSEHEFYFSALAEAHLLAFGRLLAGASG